MTSLTVSVRADVEVDGAASLREMRWESNSDFMLDIDLGDKAGGIVVILDAVDARRLADAIRAGLE